MKAGRIIKRATDAYAKGQCLRAGQLIDQAYRAVGQGKVPTKLRRLDEKFERSCVRKHPQKGLK